MDNTLCKTCGKLIPKKHFARHLLSHSEEKTFSCHICAKKYKTKDVLNCHLKTHRKPENIQYEHLHQILNSLENRFKSVYNKTERYFLILKELENKHYSK